MPVPSIFDFSAPSRLNGSNRRSSLSEVMPRPLSAMRRQPLSPPRSQLTTTLPPARLYLTALLSRLTSTWRIRTRSARTQTECGRRARLEVVDRDRARLGVRREQVDAGLGGERRDHRQRVDHDFLEVDRLHRDHHLARLDARQVEHVVDQREQMRAGVLDVLDALELRHRRRPGGVEAQQLGEAEHRVEGSAQLVAHARQELGLGAVGRFERRPCLALGTRDVQRGDVAQDHGHEDAALGDQLRERRLERKLLAVGARADQLLQAARRLLDAVADQESAGRPRVAPGETG